MNSLIANLPERVQNMLVFIKDFRAKNPYGPTLSEICAALNWNNRSLVQCWIIQLEIRGLVTRVPHHPRSLNVTPLTLGELA